MTTDELLLKLLPIIEAVAAREKALRTLPHPLNEQTLKLVRTDIRTLRSYFVEIPKALQDSLECPTVGESSESLHNKLQDHINMMSTWLQSVVEKELQVSVVCKNGTAVMSSTLPTQNNGTKAQTFKEHFTLGRWRLLFSGILVIAGYYAFAEDTSLTRLIACSTAWLCVCWMTPSKWLSRLE